MLKLDIKPLSFNTGVYTGFSLICRIHGTDFMGGNGFGSLAWTTKPSASFARDMSLVTSQDTGHSPSSHFWCRSSRFPKNVDQ